MKSKQILQEIDIPTFHNHFYILYDLAQEFKGLINYMEIGCYAGASACLMLQRPKTNVTTIDIGSPIDKNIAIANLKKYNIHDNQVIYIEGNSHDEKIRNLIKEIDILFIDGGHLFNDVIQDFEMYSPLVNSGGYIVFDDYRDFEFSPDVKLAVDKIVFDLKNYEIIGTKGKEENCFIIKKCA